MTFLLFAAVIGFNHAFEADHVLAVGNIANKRTRLQEAMRDGVYWGFGHTSMILIVGLFLILGKAVVNVSQFEFLEIFVGFSLILLGTFRLVKLVRSDFTTNKTSHTHDHKLAYSIGLLHGLAGSGAIVLLAMTEIQTVAESVIYLLLFGLGSITGMMIIAALFNLPFSKRVKVSKSIQLFFLSISALICIGYGGWMILHFML